MEGLQKIIEGFKAAEKSCQELACQMQQPGNHRYYQGKVEAYYEVVEVLRNFMAEYSVFAVKVWETQEKWDRGVQRLAEDLLKERGN